VNASSRAAQELSRGHGVAFLVDCLGRRVLRWGIHVVTGCRVAMLADPAGSKLELMEVDELRDDLDHVAYRVRDLDAAHATLLAAGCTELRRPFGLGAAVARCSLAPPTSPDVPAR
jgi:hypothetical protein